MSIGEVCFLILISPILILTGGIAIVLALGALSIVIALICEMFEYIADFVSNLL